MNDYESLKMNEFWVLFANNSFDSNRLNIQELKYPLAMHVPSSAFAQNKKLKVLEDCFSMSAEIAFLTGSDLKVGDSCNNIDLIDSFYLVISSTNNFHIKEMKNRIVNLSDQDESDAEYYTRWYDQSNIVSCELPNSRLDADFYQNTLYGNNLEFEYCNVKINEKIKYYHSPIDILKFISSFTPVYKGTLICMGNLFRQEFQLKDHNYGTAHVKINDTVHFKVEVEAVI